ncbi:hypothetical protein HOD38_02555 [archaeon]|jgi:hypothetical protein|nr:hypothetical protein [archaeon]MBT4397124.1 hypothetical protein [archaeon]MBT4441570.1 hypothetical protein [archaeon]
MFKKPTKKQLYYYYIKKKLSIRQIAKKLQIGSTSVDRYLKKYNIQTRKSIEGQKLRLLKIGKFGGYLNEKLSEEQNQFVFGTLLGDGTLGIGKRNTQARLKIEHSSKDSSYVEYKARLLGNFVTGGINTYSKYNKKNDKKYTCTYFITKTHPEFTKIHKIFYKRKIKVLKKEVLDIIGELGLAIWIMDDGYYNKKSRFIEIYTMNFDYHEHLTIQKWFKEKYNIYSKICWHKQSERFYLRFNQKDTAVLIEHIKPYIVAGMERKMGKEIAEKFVAGE